MESDVLEIAGIIIMAFIVLGVHELGHLITGIWQGFRFELFVVGPLGVKREEGKVKVYFNKNLQYYGGVAATIPLDDRPENSKKFGNILIAGPIASLIFAAIMGGIYYLFQFPYDKVILTGALISVGIFFATTIPSKSGVFFSDRKRYQRLNSSGPEREVELAILRIMGIYGRDNSYVNINPADIQLMVDDPDFKLFGLFNKLCYQYQKFNAFDPETEEAYKAASKDKPKSFVKVLDKEIEKIQES